MSTAYKNRRKNIKKFLDEKDPERKEIRNAVRSGKAPRLSRTKKKLAKGTYKSKGGKFRVVSRTFDNIKFSVGVMLGK